MFYFAQCNIFDLSALQNSILEKGVAAPRRGRAVFNLLFAYVCCYFQELSLWDFIDSFR